MFLREGGSSLREYELTEDLGLKTRFFVSWDDVESVHLPKFAELLGLARKQVRLPSAEEWNFLGNLFNWLREHRAMDLPDLGATRSWEWCLNRRGSGYRLIAGHVEDVGLADVYCNRRGDRNGSVAFRALAVP